MKKLDYLNAITACKVNESKVKKAEKEYGFPFPDELQRIVSFNQDTIFLDDSVRILSYSEIVDAKKDLHVDFVSQGIIPIADCGDNDFIVYHFTEKNWSLYNIVEEISFRAKKELSMLL